MTRLALDQAGAKCFANGVSLTFPTALDSPHLRTEETEAWKGQAACAGSDSAHLRKLRPLGALSGALGLNVGECHSHAALVLCAGCPAARAGLEDVLQAK